MFQKLLRSIILDDARGDAAPFEQSPYVNAYMLVYDFIQLTTRQKQCERSRTVGDENLS